MAPKRGQRSIRFTNVTNIGVEEKAASLSSSTSSSDVESGSGNKVRKMFSTKRLRKESECYNVKYDHIYPGVNLCQINKRKKNRKVPEENNRKPVKSQCFSKNAIMARLNRERKKAYISKLENDNESLREQNNEVKKKVDLQSKTITVMKREIIYLKGLLANSKELGQILKNLQNTTSLPVTSSLISKMKDNNFFKSVCITPEDGFKESNSYEMQNTLVKFPMIYDDINLGSTFDKSLISDDFADFENSLVKDESDSFHSEFNENFICAFEEPLKWADSSFYSNASVTDFGICLHVNQKRISIEVCSICNNKANLCSHEHITTSKIDST